MAETEYKRLVAVVCACGTNIPSRTGPGPQKKHCSNYCKDKAANRNLKRAGIRKFVCGVCGIGFDASKTSSYCSSKCASIARSKKSACVDCGALIWKGSTRCTPCAKPLVLERACAGCGVMFKPKPGGNKGVYCSRGCAFKHIWEWRSAENENQDKPGDYSNVFFKTCKHCGKQWTARRDNSLLCSDDCRKLYSCKKSRLLNIDKCKRDLSSRLCKCCGKQFSPKYGDKRNTYCSTACLKKHTARVSKGKRRAIERGVDAENIDPFKVFERDKWKCQLCGVKTPKGKRGTYADNAPELDHIMPLSKGGNHKYTNTQCLCRRCNSLKSDKPLGQLLMFG